jgi:CelD/BcsL family acetyltransferase involved in cellulose biosynthesis
MISPVVDVEPLKTVASSALRSRLVKSLSEFRAILLDWDRVWSLDPERQIFQHLGWVQAWLDAYGAEYELFTPLIYRGDTLIGILPLVRKHRELRFIGFSNSDYNCLLADPTEAVQVLELSLQALQAEHFVWDILLLENVPEESMLAKVLEVLPVELRKQFQQGPKAPSPTLLLAEGKADTLKQLLGKDKLKKTARYFERVGPASFRHLESDREAKLHLPIFMEQHIRRQPFAGRQSGFTNQHASRFYEALFKYLNPEKELRFSVLQAGNHSAAYHLGFELDGKYLFYKPTFDVNLWDYSPDQALLFHMFKHFQDVPTREFDFCLGGESYKYRFANHCRHNLSFRYYAKTNRGLLKRKLDSIITTAKTKIQTHPTWGKRVTALQEGAHEKINEAKREGLKIVLGSLAAALLRTYVLRREQKQIYRLCLDRIQNHVRPLTTQKAALADLADAGDEAGALHASRLHEARDRIKRGGIPYISKAGGSFQQLAWVYKAEAGFHNGVSVCKPEIKTWVIEEIWSSRSNQRNLRGDLLRHVAYEASQENIEVRVLACQTMPFYQRGSFLQQSLELESNHCEWRVPLLDRRRNVMA